MGNFTKVWLTAALSGCYCYGVSKYTEKGLLRLVLILPVANFFAAAPFYLLSCLNLSGITWFFLSWLGISKLLLFAFDMGPLAADQRLSLLHFVYTLLLPIKTEAKSGSDPVKSKGSLISRLALFGTKVVILGCVIEAYRRYKEGMPFWWMTALLCCYLYLGLEVLLDIAGVLARTMLGLELAPQAYKPYLSSSLQDFWGRRWNLMVSDVLRQTVFNPIRKLATPFIGKKSAILVGVFASFLVSGLMHEWLYILLIGVPRSMEVTWFFSLHGACLVIELMIKEAIGSKWRLHPVVSGSFTIAFVVVTSAWWHFPTVIRSNTHEKFAEEYAIFGRLLKKNVMYVFGHQQPPQ